jgi:hypothetical protein
VPRVLLSINVVVTESSTLSSLALGKDFFVECPKKHSAKRISTLHPFQNIQDIRAFQYVIFYVSRHSVYLDA